jgi:hypothetical protein
VAAGCVVMVARIIDGIARWSSSIIVVAAVIEVVMGDNTMIAKESAVVVPSLLWIRPRRGVRFLDDILDVAPCRLELIVFIAMTAKMRV